MNLTNVTITTKRLELVPVSEIYANKIFHEFTPEVTTYMFPKPPRDINDTLQFIKTAQEKLLKGEDLTVTILKINTEEFLGGGGAHKVNTDTPELGIWIKKSAHGHKYGREAVTAIKEWLDNNIHYKYIKYPVDKRNIASRKIAEWLGGIAKTEYKKQNMSDNILDIVEYHIYRDK